MKTIQNCFTFDLDEGVRPVEVELVGDNTAWGIGSDGRSSWMHGQFRLGKNLFMTVAEAATAAEAARVKKITSLRKQLNKLEALKFA